MDNHRTSPSGQFQQPQQDATSLRSSTDAMEESPPKADTGPDTSSEQRIPATPGLEIGENAPGRASLPPQSRISATPIEVVRALEELRALSDERVLGAIRAFRTEILSRLDSIDATSKARLDAHKTTIETRLDLLDSRSEARMVSHEAKSKARMDIHEIKSKSRMDIHEIKSKGRMDVHEIRTGSRHRRG